jgi:GT2 family glycosyltransferase/lipopolysaccharide/colanic/teichoic acid biosynthesis glycosyltransferase
VNVSIIIVSYNSRAVLKPCLESIRKQRFAGDIEVLVVDNNSHDGTPELVAVEFPEVILLAQKENYGYSRGVNLGIRRAQGDYFLILNPDTVMTENAVDRLVTFMDRQPDAGVAGSKLVFHDGTLQYSCRRFYTWKVLLLRRTPLGRIFKHSKAVADHLMLDYDHETTREVDWLLGACLLVRRSAVESVGLMDERFFLYFEDVDWCYRMKQNGWRVFYCPDSVVIHGYARESAQSVINRSFVAHLASLIRYYEKWNFILYFIKKYREIGKVLLFLAMDIAAFNIAFLCAYYLRVSLQGVFTNPILPIGIYAKLVLFENLLFIFSYLALGLYRIRRETTYIDELFEIIRAIVFASILLMTSTYLSQIRIYSRMVVVFLVPFAILFDWAFRAAVRAFHRRLLSLKIDLKRVCLVGPIDRARELELTLFHNEVPGMDVVGVVTVEDRPPGMNHLPGEGGLGGGLGHISDLESIVDRYRIQEVVFLPRAVSDERLAEFITMGRRRVLDITVMSDFPGLVKHEAAVNVLAGRPVIAYYRDTRYVFDRFTKRALDIGLGLVFTLVSSPFFMLYYLYASARGGKPFTYERRLGQGGVPFSLPIAGAGGPDGPSDLVSLPLFWLVVIGRMSLVGPYPMPEASSSAAQPRARFRLDIRPGITGLWRKGGTSSLGWDDMLAQDAYYIQNWSLIKDFKILFTTAGKILAGHSRRLPGID